MLGWGGMDWIDLDQDSYQLRALVNTVMNFRVPLNVEKFLSSCTTGGFSRRAHLRKGISGQKYNENSPLQDNHFRSVNFIIHSQKKKLIFRKTYITFTVTGNLIGLAFEIHCIGRRKPNPTTKKEEIPQARNNPLQSVAMVAMLCRDIT
jgi:hypothetical protein